MRSYFIDELNSEEMEKITNTLKKQNLKQPVEGLYWLYLPENLYTPQQKEHLKTCGPYYFAIETGKNWLKLELLIRAEQKIRCACISYATQEQRDFLISFAENLLQELNIFI
ncbi:hypothetical protein [Desulfonauticus submarinus]